MTEVTLRVRTGLGGRTKDETSRPGSEVPIDTEKLVSGPKGVWFGEGLVRVTYIYRYMNIIVNWFCLSDTMSTTGEKGPVLRCLETCSVSR